MADTASAAGLEQEFLAFDPEAEEVQK